MTLSLWEVDLKELDTQGMSYLSQWKNSRTPRNVLVPGFDLNSKVRGMILNLGNLLDGRMLGDTRHLITRLCKDDGLIGSYLVDRGTDVRGKKGLC